MNDVFPPAGRRCQWLPPYIHSRGVFDGSSPCSSTGWQRNGVLQHERVYVNGKPKQEPGRHRRAQLTILRLQLLVLWFILPVCFSSQGPVSH